MIRSLLFNLAFYATTLVLGLLFLPAMLGPRRWTCKAMQLWAQVCLAEASCIAGIRIRKGRWRALPEGPVILAPKHQSALDILIMLAYFDAPAFVLKRELMWLPVLGWYAARSQQIWIARDAGSAAVRKMMRAASEVVADGRPVIVFPEGTRTQPGSEPPLKPGIVAIYRHLGATIVPIALDSGYCWGRLSFRKQPGIVHLSVETPFPPGLGRHDLLDRLHAAINEDPARQEQTR